MAQKLAPAKKNSRDISPVSPTFRISEDNSTHHSLHLITASSCNVQRCVAVVVDDVGVGAGPQDHRQGVLQSFLVLQKFLLPFL